MEGAKAGTGIGVAHEGFDGKGVETRDNRVREIGVVHARDHSVAPGADHRLSSPE